MLPCTKHTTKVRDKLDGTPSHLISCHKHHNKPRLIILYDNILTKGIENGSTGSRSVGQIPGHTDGNAMFARRETRQASRNLARGAIRLRESQIAQHIIVAAAGNLTHSFASSSHDYRVLL